MERLIRECDYELFLDIGPGAGKYGRMIRKHKPDAKIIGIEAHCGYIGQYRLNQVYDDLVVGRAEEILWEDVGRTWDCVIMGDVIEHMHKSKAVDLLHFLIYRVKAIIVLYPVKYIQYAHGGVKTEAHVSVWREADFQFADYEYEEKGFMRMVVIWGYLGDPEALRG